MLQAGYSHKVLRLGIRTKCSGWIFSQISHSHASLAQPFALPLLPSLCNLALAHPLHVVANSVTCMWFDYLGTVVWRKRGMALCVLLAMLRMQAGVLNQTEPLFDLAGSRF